jgi:hypothetical protein
MVAVGMWHTTSQVPHSNCWDVAYNVPSATFQLLGCGILCPNPFVSTYELYECMCEVLMRSEDTARIDRNENVH